MMSLALESRALGPRAVDRTPGGAANARRDSCRAIGAVATRGGDGRRLSIVSDHSEAKGRKSRPGP